MKILEVTNLFSPVHGGVAESAFQLSRYLALRGHDVTLFTSDYQITHEFPDKIPAVKVHVFKTCLNLANFHVTPGILMQTRSIKKFDIVHLHNLRTFQNVIIGHYANKNGIPFILQPYGGVNPVLHKQTLKRLYDRVVGNRILQKASKIIAGVEVEIEEMNKMGVDRSRIITIPHLYDTAEFTSLPPKGQFREKYDIKEKHIIMFLGRIHKIKGIDFLIDAFNQLSKQRQDVLLVVVGPDGGYKSTLEEQIVRLDLSEKVLFTGQLRGAEKVSALVDASMLVQTSIYERSPGSPFDAILADTPIIITSGTGAGEVVSRLDAGYLVEYGKILELVTLMQKVLNDPAEIKEKTRKARQYILDNLSWQKRVEDYERVYESVVTSR